MMIFLLMILILVCFWIFNKQTESIAFLAGYELGHKATEYKPEEAYVKYFGINRS